MDQAKQKERAGPQSRASTSEPAEEPPQPAPFPSEIELLRAIVAGSTDAIFAKDLGGRYRLINPAGARMLGRTVEEVLGRTDRELFDPWDVDRVLSQDREVFSSGELRTFESIGSVHGRTRAFLATKWPLRDEGGRVVALLGISRDISARKRAEEQAQRTSRQLGAVLASVNEGVIVADEHGRFAYFNPSARRILGITEAEEPRDLDHTPYRLLLPDGSTPFPHERRPLVRALRGEETRDVEMVVERPGGARVHVSVSGGPVRDENGVFRGGVIVFRDITERRRAEQALRRATVRLTTVNRELEAFSYTVAHDLRSPLRTIEGFAEALAEDYGDRLDDTGREHLQRIRAAALRMEQLIEGLLSLSQVTRSELRREPVDLTALARSVAEQLRKQEPEREVDLSVEEGMRAAGDPRLLRVILENLLGNAWKFTRMRPRARVEVFTTREDGRVVYHVRDDGAGFDPARGDRLFTPFQRLHGADEFEGTGIGLATVQRIVERHGGRIRGEGQVGRGATFSFTLGEGGPAD